jgi:hypothetical protein
LLLNSKSRDVKPNLYSTAESDEKSQNANRRAEIVTLAASPTVAAETTLRRKI